MIEVPAREQEHVSAEPIMHTFYLRIRPDRIALFRFLLEGYDGLAVLSTVDVGQGLVRLIVPASGYIELWRLIAAVCPDLALAASDCRK